MKQTYKHAVVGFRGFTLVEVLITIIIIGILSTLGLVAFRSAQKKGRDLQRKTGLVVLSKALESFMSDKGVYPDSSNDGKILWCGSDDAPDAVECEWGSSWLDNSLSQEEKTVYMSVLPKDVIVTQKYVYEAVEINGLRKGYRLFARLENTQDMDVSEYATNCSADASIVLPCNYVYSSEAVASLPTPFTPAEPTATTAPVATSTPTSTPEPTSIHTVPTKIPPLCVVDGMQCREGLDTCCSGSCVLEYVDASGSYGICGSSGTVE
jgi:prepilin-type N-terminal cleavage/methylation domain-containing protein